MKQLQISDINLEGVSAIVFDLDGTLYDKKYYPLRLVLSDLRHAFLASSERRARRLLKGQYFGNPEAFYRSLFWHISRHQNIPFQQARDWYFATYMPLTIRLMKKYYHVGEFVEPLIRALKERGIKTAVFSDYPCVEEKLIALGADLRWFDYLFIAPEMGGLKPNKQLFENMIAQMEEEAQSVIMIGDREDTDGDGARAVGMRFIKV